MNNPFDKMTNKDLAEYCESEGINVESKNVSKPTKPELLKAIQEFELKQREPVEDIEDIPEIEVPELPVMTDAEEFLAQANDEVPKETVVQKEAKKLTRGQKRRIQYNELMPLKRVIITSNADNQTKTNLIFITWGNGLIGHNTDRVYLGKPWHVRKGALDNMRGAMTRISIQDDEGNQVRFETVPTYNIVDLKSLTKEEIERIGKRQVIRDASIESLI